MILPLILLIFTLVVLIPIAIFWRGFAPWVPTRKSDLERIFELAKLKQGEVFYDLGCGDGRLVIHASRVFNARSVGIEAALPFYLLSKARALAAGQRNVEIKWKSLFREHLGEADVIYLFGTMDTLGENFQKKLQEETKAGARVISYAFGVGTLVPHSINRPSEQDLPIYVYRF